MAGNDELLNFFSKPRTAAAPTIVDYESAPVRPPEEPLDVESTDRRDADESYSLDEMLKFMLEKGGSDLFLTVNSEPMVSVHDRMTPVEGFSKMSGKQIEATIYSILTGEQRKSFEERKELDASYAIPGLSRFRVNVFRSKGHAAAVLRAIPFEIKPISKLGLPASINDYANLPRGLVLVTGPTGSGKSTTLAAIIDQINRTKSGHILTIEDPIEFIHGHKGCIVNQREIGVDTDSFENALKAALREKPDYVLVGELRDLETISLAVTIAETGHLVFGTLHTQSSAETISRIVDVFPADQQDQIRTQLAATLQGVVCQNLVRTADGKGRVAAIEIMNITQSIKTKIIKNQLNAITSDLQLGKDHGMQTMDSHLVALAKEGRITIESALEKSHRRSDMLIEFGGEREVERLIARQQGDNRLAF
jgi:twitching motility protein PilT